ncbi:hypothetical protein PPL_08257 [Heterostelium album PN500]|uniref:Uncharacterized protein n=1 Tax=Heterostelium pallidum (strain ATCC 26659 / Pp 5 / PN500) TaxID=670386 RepID=D3BJ20_HETP5|nr:hypothetical protein PPL_08257 [Heterostelium album PN500]EFA78794.1 hypothetical protein PPL_08257 [Heterostelium album PN500]|eukprot:XP_020430918.1 hypothetical protein PPL_08257 [Heterostelium album PN500]
MFLNNEILEASNHNNNNNINNNNNEDNSSTFINIQIKSIWESLKSSTSQYQSLSATENKISQHFEQLHQYLVIEEHKLKKPILNDKQTITNQIDIKINHLKYLVNIININYKLNNNKLLNNKMAKDNNSNNNYNSNSNNSQSMVEDTTSKYSPTTIMKSITSSSTLQSFILNNSQILFNEHHDPFNIDELIKQHNNDSSSLLLDIIHKYNNQFNKTTEINDNNKKNETPSYKLLIKQLDFNQLNSIISQSIKLLSSATTTNNNDNKSSYIFTTNRSGGATLINTSNNNSIEQFNFDYYFRGTYQSIVSIGEYIYVFGGFNNPNKWMKFSIKSKSIEHIGDIEGIEGGSYISVCYDGQDHIYLFNGYDRIKNRIDRFNIKTMKFERYHQLPDEYGEQISTMILNGSLYSITTKVNKVIQFDLKNKTISTHKIELSAYSACHDNNGNFYLYQEDNKKIVKYNVENKQTINLDPIPAKEDRVYLMYHRESSTSSFIYSFGGVNFGNYKYSIEDNHWEPFLEDDKFEREWCSSTSIID